MVEVSILNDCYRNHIKREMLETPMPVGVSYLVLKSSKKDFYGVGIYTYKCDKRVKEYKMRFLVI